MGGGGDQKLKCPKCDDSFGAKENLDKHLNSDHSQFGDFSELSLDSNGSISDLYIKCPKCTSSFENELDLQTHVEVIHSESSNRKRKCSGEVDIGPKKKKEEFICKSCNLKFSRKDSLQKGIRI